MVAQLDPRTYCPSTPTDSREGRVLRWRPVSSSSEGRMSDTHAAEKLRPARGLLLGLLLGAFIWLGMGVLAWYFFH